MFSSVARSSILSGLHERRVDVLIIGGGITGAGIALDSVTRGLNTVLLEMQDFAAGTSSRSTKLVHGGLRYLKQFEVKMVAEVGKERGIVYENGPHVTTPEWMLLPIHKGGTFGKFSTSIGLRFYDFLAGVKRSERRKMLDAKTTLKKEPLLKKDGLKGGGYYVEYRTDDARLTIEVVKKAVECGAKAVNYAKVEEFVYKNGKVIGVKVIDQLNGNDNTIYAKKVVNATGPWVDTVRKKDASTNGKTLKLTKGVHIVIDQKRFPLKQAIYYDTPDGRMVFAIPRDGKTYVGTTDTFYEDDIASPHITTDDRDYLIHTINFMFPEVNVTVEDIESSWSGLRPLILEAGKDPSEISRKDEIWQSESGLITIAGGKLTGYRKMAEMVVNSICKSFENKSSKRLLACQTKKMPISGGDIGGSSQFSTFIINKVNQASQYGLTVEDGERLARLYGSNVDKVFDIISKSGREAKLYRLPVEVYASLIYGIENEMVTKPTDYFVRRTGSLFFNINWVHEWKERILSCMSSKLKWSKQEKDEYRLELEQQLLNATQPVDDKKVSII